MPVAVPRTNTRLKNVAYHVLFQNVRVRQELRTQVIVTVSGNRQEGAGQPRGATPEPRQ